MATAQVPSVAGRWARSPFYFNSAAHLLRIGRDKATNLSELLEVLRRCPEDSIFQHTFQTLHEHRIQDTAGLARSHHGHVEAVEHLRVPAQRLRE